ncbi:MAG: energy transducer TonB [Acidobacteriota bacterium]|jgi:hypothetical protein
MWIRMTIGLWVASIACAQDCAPKYVAAPRFPVLAFQAGVNGRVRVELSIRADGTVASVQFDGDKLFRSASESAGLAWKFTPGVERKCSAIMVYRIMAPGTGVDELTTRFESPLTVEVRRETAEATVLVDPAPVPPKRK